MRIRPSGVLWALGVYRDHGSDYSIRDPRVRRKPLFSLARNRVDDDEYALAHVTMHGNYSVHAHCIRYMCACAHCTTTTKACACMYVQCIRAWPNRHGRRRRLAASPSPTETRGVAAHVTLDAGALCVCKYTPGSCPSSDTYLMGNVQPDQELAHDDDEPLHSLARRPSDGRA